MNDNSSTIWPDQVQHAADKIINVIQDLLVPEETNEEYLRQELSRAFFEKFLSGEELLLTEDEFTQVYSLASIHTTLSKLSEKGLVKSIENEHGEELFFLTEKGKEEAQHYSSELIHIGKSLDLQAP